MLQTQDATLKRTIHTLNTVFPKYLLKRGAATPSVWLASRRKFDHLADALRFVNSAIALLTAWDAADSL